MSESSALHSGLSQHRGFPRSKKTFLSVGSIPLQSFNSNIDYYNDISYTVYGTIGIKVWVFEK